MPGKRSRVITGWRQVKPAHGSSGRRFFSAVAAKAAARTAPIETTGSDRWESEGGSLVAPAGLAPAAIAAKPKIPK